MVTREEVAGKIPREDRKGQRRGKLVGEGNEWGKIGEKGRSCGKKSEGR